jgi:metal-responsive CopG/Arc/MetJ family transcriptional regulator
MKGSFIPKLPDTTTISLRLPDELLERVEKLAKKQKMSRSELLRQAIIHALKDLDKSIEEN